MLDLRLSGKTAIVTGGSAGIGMASAKALFTEGASIVIAARNKPEKAAASIRKISDKNRESEVITVSADLTKADSAKSVYH
jgi:NAD(P)-dependent dehydrogenase (short-subunit alcohol dehydrogenase family)